MPQTRGNSSQGSFNHALTEASSSQLVTIAAYVCFKGRLWSRCEANDFMSVLYERGCNSVLENLFCLLKVPGSVPGICRFSLEKIPGWGPDPIQLSNADATGAKPMAGASLRTSLVWLQAPSHHIQKEFVVVSKNSKCLPETFKRISGHSQKVLWGPLSRSDYQQKLKSIRDLEFIPCKYRGSPAFWEPGWCGD